MIKISLLIVSFIVGAWNVTYDVSSSIRHNIAVFMLGFSFCYGSAVVADVYGLSSEVSAFVGYICGVLSNQIYDALAKFVKHTPDIVEKKIRGRIKRSVKIACKE